MSRGATLSIYGLYKYDNTIFDNMMVPDVINKDDLINNIILDCAEMQLLYPDASMMKDAIGIWSNARIHAWNRMAIVMYEDYDPFINIKRDEVREITQDRNLHDDGTSTNKVSGWNEDGYVDKELNNVNSSQTGSVTTRETFHVEGDSAITDAQDVAKKEMELRDKYDLYKYIINDFRNKFCLSIY